MISKSGMTVFESFNKARGLEICNTELTSQQRDKVISVIDSSITERFKAARSKTKTALVLEIGCYICLCMLFRHSTKSIWDMITKGGTLWGWIKVFFAVSLLWFSIKALTTLCIKPYWECYFGELPTLKKYLLKGKVLTAKGLRVGDNLKYEDTNIHNILTENNGMAVLKSMLLKSGVMYTSALTRQKFKRIDDSKIRDMKSIVLFSDVDSIVEQIESSECLILYFKPAGKKCTVMFTTSM